MRTGIAVAALGWHVYCNFMGYELHSPGLAVSTQ